MRFLVEVLSVMVDISASEGAWTRSHSAPRALAYRCVHSINERMNELKR